MFEKNEYDFSIFYNENKNNFSIYIGTFSNSNQSLIDCLMYLKLVDYTREKNFKDELLNYNGLFINNKENIIKDIKENGFNFLNSVLNDYEMEQYITELEYSDKQENHLKENQEYIFNYQEFDKNLEKEYTKEIIDLINDSKNIVELYDKLMLLYKEIQEYYYNNLFDYLETREI